MQEFTQKCLAKKLIAKIKNLKTVPLGFIYIESQYYIGLNGELNWKQKLMYKYIWLKKYNKY